jgi:3-oxoacyl-[acyl-carrier-protein] synthase II
VGVASDRRRREPGSVAVALKGFAADLKAKPDAIVSGATGVARITEEESEAAAAIAGNAALHATGDLVGHMMEGQAPAGVGLAAALIARGGAGEALVTSVGHWRGEGALRLMRPR